MHTTRASYLSSVRSVVVKLGTQLLSDGEGGLDAALFSSIARQIVALRAKGIQCTLVSSGAIGAGMRELKLSHRPTDLARLQAVAAVGQRRLMDTWGDAFAAFSLPVAQILLTREDIEDRARYLNLRNTIHAIHELSAVPVINENDTISTDELVKISFGDNDLLAALVTHALRADLLILLTIVDGLLDAAGKTVPLVPSIEDAQLLIRPEKSQLGKGGMDSKLAAARRVTEAGESLIVANGRMDDVLMRIVSGEDSVGTLFVPAARKWSSRSRWISSVRPAGAIIVDEGCAAALVHKNRSLLPAGIIRVEGEFDRGDPVAIVDKAGQTIARGLSNYASSDIALIAGKKTSQVRAQLADAAYDEVVHRDNLVLG